MNPEIKKLREELLTDARDIENFYRNEGLLGFADCWAARMRRSADILQAVFDPENQPSQYGTTLYEKPK